MRGMSNLEYNRLVSELQGLVGGRLDRLYDMGGGEFRLRIRLQGKTEDVWLKLGERLHLTRYIRDAPKEPSNLAMFLRKRIEGARIESLEQHDFDRVLVFRFSGEKKHSLVLEMFAEGNLFLLDSDGKIIRCLRREEWKDRTLKEGEHYKFPQSERLSPPFSKDSLERILESKAIISILVSKTNFGNDYLEEACKRAGIGLKENAKNIKEERLEALASELNAVFKILEPIIYLKDGKPTDYSLASLSKYSSLESRKANSLSEAVDECANSEMDAQAPAPSEHSKKLERLKKRLELQKEHCERMLKEAEELKKTGDEIYLRYQEIEGILNSIQEMKKAGKSWVDIKKALEGKCEIDEHKGKVYFTPR
ncbi:MAG: NFACT family protein [Candidatus Micrarchaeota archaeon]